MACQRILRAVVEPALASNIVDVPAGAHVGGGVGRGEAKRAWTREEDEALRAAIVATGDCNDWVHAAVAHAASAPWMHGISMELQTASHPHVIFFALCTVLWRGRQAGVARLVPGRSRCACLLRWKHAVDPSLRKGRWSTAECDAAHRRALIPEPLGLRSFVPRG